MGDEYRGIFLLVQGGNMSTDTWNKLSGREDYPPGGHLGARYWDGTVKMLEAHNYRVFAPTLIDEFKSNLTGHIDQICKVIKNNDLNDVILVGHSYGGFVITGVANKLTDRIKMMIYLDSAVPDPGQSLIDVLDTVYSKDNYKAAVPKPSPPYVEKIEYDPDRIKYLKKVYIRCTDSEFKDISMLVKDDILLSTEDWDFYELQSSHVPMADVPDEFYRLLLEIVSS